VSDAVGEGSSQWKTFGERVIYDNPWVWLGQVDVELPGGERFWHHVVRLHRAAMTVLVDKDDRVLLLWRHRFVQDRWGWELPGGLIDEGEEPIETAARELEEETGYRAGRLEHLVTFARGLSTKSTTQLLRSDRMSAVTDQASSVVQVFTSGMDWPAVVAAISGGIVGVTGILASWRQSIKTVNAEDERDKRVEKRRVYAQCLTAF
jgi:predicted NUDIX family NTP pyrophosphohydrolase